MFAYNIKKEGTIVSSDLMKYLDRGWSVELIYLSKAGEISKRKVKLLRVEGDIFYAYCFKQKAKRTFRIDHILALIPVISQERGAV